MNARVRPLFQTVDDDVLDEAIDRWPDHDIRGSLAREVRAWRRTDETASDS